MEPGSHSCPGRLAPPGFCFLRRAAAAPALLLAVMICSSRAEDEPAATIVVEAEPLSDAEALAPTSFVTVIDTDRYEGQLETASGALAQAVGVQVRQFGGLGSFSTLSIRGSNANQVRFYLDGVPLSTARQDVVNLANLPLDSLERLEIYRGSVPIGFGADGIGGVVNLVTRRPTAEPRSEIAAYYGSYNTAKGVASHSQKAGDYELLGQLTYQHTDGDFEFLDDNGTPFDPDDDSRSRRLNNSFDAVEGLFKVRRRVSEWLEIDFTSDTFWKQQGVPSVDSNQALATSLDYLRALNYLRGRAFGLADDSIDVTATLFAVYENDSFTDLERELFGIGIDADQDGVSAGGNVLGLWYADEYQTPSAFLELEYQTFASRDLIQDEAFPQQERLDFNAALQDEIALFDRRIVVVPVVRYQHLADQVTGQFTPAGQPLGGRTQRESDLWSPSIGLELRPWSWLALKGNLGRYHRPPNFSELFGTRGFVRGNPDLEPEVGLNRDVGFVAAAPAWRWLDEAKLEYAYFNNDVENLIALRETSFGFTFANFADARVRGHELSLHSVWAQHVTADVNYTHQDAQNLSQIEFLNELPLRPSDEAYVRLELFGAPGKVYYELSYVDGNFNDLANFDPVSSRATHSVGLLLRAFPWLAVGFEIQNLTDNEVRDLLDFPLPGRSFIGSLTSRF